MALRIDSYSKLPWEKKSDGRYWTHVTLGQVGTDLKYYSRKDDGQIVERTEVVTEEGLFNDDSVKSLVGLPIVLTHPKGKTYRLNQEGGRVGTILSSFGREDGKLIAEAIIDDIRGVTIIDNLLKNGQSPEASSGYQLRNLVLRDDGKYEQIRGDYDHVAAPLLPGMARGGKDIVLRFDVNDAVSDRSLLDAPDSETERRSDQRQPQKQIFDLGAGGAVKMKDIIVRLDTKDVLLKNVSEETEEVINALKSRNDTLLSDLEGVEEMLEEVQEERDALKARVDSIPEVLPANKEEVDIGAEIKARLDAWKLVGDVLSRLGASSPVPDYQKDIPQIAKVGIKAIQPDLNLDALSPEEVLAVWQGMQLAVGRTQELNTTTRFRKTDDFLQSQRVDAQGGEGKNSVASAYENAHKTSKRRGSDPR